MYHFSSKKIKMLAGTPLNSCPGQRGIEARCHSFQMNDMETEMRSQKFKNRIVINITQCQTFGSVLDIRKDDTTGLVSEARTDSGISLRFLLGEQHPVYKVIGNRIGNAVFRESELPILLTLALKDKTPDIFKKIMDSVEAIDVWSMF